MSKPTTSNNGKPVPRLKLDSGGSVERSHACSRQRRRLGGIHADRQEDDGIPILDCHVLLKVAICAHAHDLLCPPLTEEAVYLAAVTIEAAVDDGKPTNLAHVSVQRHARNRGGPRRKL